MNSTMLQAELPLLKGGNYIKWLIYIGFFWLVLGVAYIPINKIYQQGVVVFLYIPLLFIIAFNLKLLFGVFISNKVFFILCGAVFLYAAINGFYFNNLQSSKHVLYVAVFIFLGVFVVLLNYHEKILINSIGFLLVAVLCICLYSFYNFFYLNNNALLDRMSGVLGVNHPILASYYIGSFLILSIMLFSKQRLYMLAFILTYSLFIFFAQSRGAYLAIFITVLIYIIIFFRKDKLSIWPALIFLIFAIILVYFFSDQIFSRGVSYRPEILKSSLAMAVENLWFGHGMGHKFLIYTVNYPAGFDHTHNLPLHVFIELGLVGVVLFTFLWIYCFYFCYKNKDLFLARFNILLIVFSSIAYQFDAASFIAQPRLEWFVVWVPVCITAAVITVRYLEGLSGKIKNGNPFIN